MIDDRVSAQLIVSLDNFIMFQLVDSRVVDAYMMTIVNLLNDQKL